MFTNYDKWKDDLIEIGKYFGVSKDEHEVFSCSDDYGLDRCGDCKFCETACEIEKIEWLLKEPKKRIELTPLEKEMVKAMDDGYLVRDKRGLLKRYDNRPKKNYCIESWESTYTRFPSLGMHIIYTDWCSSDLFDFIKWSDSYPFCIKNGTLEYEGDKNEDYR